MFGSRTFSTDANDPDSQGRNARTGQIALPSDDKQDLTS